MLLGEVWAGAAKGLYRCHRCDAGHRRRRRHPDRRTSAGGARGLGGELGHFRLHALDGVACTCGAIGCYERYAATTVLVRSAQKAMGWMPPTGARFFEAAAAGDARTLAVLNGWINEIAQGLAGPCTHLQPAADPDRRRRQRAAGASDRPAGRAGAQKHHARLRRGASRSGLQPSRTTPALSAQCIILSNSSKADGPGRRGRRLPTAPP